MRIDKELRHRFEHEIERLIEIANGEREEERVYETLGSARLYWKFRRRKGKPPTRGECFSLLRNQTQEAQTLLDSWMESGHEYGKWKAQYPKLFVQVEGTVSDTYYSLDELNDEPITTRLYVLGKEPARSFCVYDLNWLFLNLLQNPLRNDLAKCDRCREWFLNRSGHRNKRFCRRRCAVLDSVTRWVKQRRERERHEKVKRAQAAIRDWTRDKGDDWKAWVSKRTCLSEKFLTRALNRGELKSPAGI
jgi:hypothetical protein